MYKDTFTYGMKKVDFEDIELVDPDKIKEISSCEIVCCGIETKRAYAMTEPRNKGIELNLINKIEEGSYNLLDILSKLGSYPK